MSGVIDQYKIAHAETSLTAFVGPAESGPVAEPVPVASVQDFDRVFGGQDPGTLLRNALADYFANGGSRALVVRSAEAAVDGGHPALQALDALEQAGGFNLLCVLPDAPSGDVDPAVALRAEAVCVRRLAMLIFDAPAAWSAVGAVAAAISELSAGSVPHLPTTSNAALYFPRLRRPGDPDALSPACGAVAGIIARTDSTRGVWKSPAGAGASLDGGLTPAVLLSSAEGDHLNGLGVNCIRQFPAGACVWGARTAHGANGGDAEFRYISVRRLALHVQESVERGLDWVTFEPNEEPTWAAIRAAVGEFLQGMYRDGAFQGARPRDAWFVNCDANTTSQYDRDIGRVNLLVGIAPLKPAEFLLLPISIMADTPHAPLPG